MLKFLLEPLPWFVTKRYLYHLDKIAHTALFAIALAALSGLVRHPVPLTVCAIWAAALYVVVGKVIWYTSDSYRSEAIRAHYTGKDPATEPYYPLMTWRDYLPRPELDWFSDAALSWCVVILAATYDGRWLGWLPTVVPPLVYLLAVALRKTSP